MNDPKVAGMLRTSSVGYYKVNVTGLIDGILIEINETIEIYTCRVERPLPEKRKPPDVTWKIWFLFYDGKT